MLPNYKNSPRCYYCQRQFDEVLYRTKDHIISLSAGGCNHVLNYIPACLDCNVLKSGNSLPEFARLLEGHCESKYASGLVAKMYDYLPMMARRAWKLYNKTKWLHDQYNSWAQELPYPNTKFYPVEPK